MDCEQIRKSIARTSRKIIEDPTRIPSAVLLLLYKKHDILHLLFTKRTEEVADHKGQISFPGGVRDQSDASWEATALREAFEEVGIHAEQVEVLGLLDDCATVGTSYVITPVVGCVSFPPQFHLNSREVAGVIEIPLTFFQDFLREQRFVPAPMGGGPAFRYGEELVWGATARIVIQFLSLLSDE